MNSSPGSVTECVNQTNLNMAHQQKDIYVHVTTKVFATATAILTIILGCYGNGTILATAIKMCTAKTVRLERYMTNLALADVLVCVIVCPSYIYLLHSIDDKKDVCLTWTFSLVAFGTASLGTLDMIAVHRQGRVIWKKSHSKWGLGRTMCIMLFLWLVGILLAIGALLHMTQSLTDLSQMHALPNECLLATNRAILFLAPVYLISLTVILLCYSKVATAVVKQGRLKKAPKNSQEQEPQTSVAKLAHDENPIKEDNEIQVNGKAAGVEGPTIPDDNQSGQVSVEKEARALLMCVLVVLTVLSTWLPFIITCVLELWQGQKFMLTQVKTCAGALVYLNSALNPLIYSSLAMKRTEGSHVTLDNSFGCLGWRRRQRNKLRAVVKAEALPKQLVPEEPETNLGQQASPQEDCRLVDVGVGPSGPLSQVFTVYGTKKGVPISSATEYPADSLTQSNRRRSSSSLTFSRIRENSVNAEVSSICSPAKDSFTFMDFCRESSWSSHRSRVTPCDKTSARF